MKNDLIEAVSSAPLVAIKKKRNKEANFVAVLVDETFKYLSAVLHYRYPYDREEVKERFLEFTDVSCDRHAQAITELIRQLLIEFEFAVKN